MEIGKYYKRNQVKLEVVDDATWAAAIEKCRYHINGRIYGRTNKGAHTGVRLGMDPYDYYLTYAYESIILGTWEWKDEYTLSQQLIRIADSTISTEVEKVKTKKSSGNKVILSDSIDSWFADDQGDSETDNIQEILDNKKISVIEECIKGNHDFESFWECIKEGMRAKEIADFMEKSPKQVYKIQERFVKKIKESTYFDEL